VTTRQVRQALLIILAAGVSAACGASRPVKYYVLDTGSAPAPVADSSPVRFSIRLLVGRVAASHLYRDDRLVYGSGPVQLGTYEYERWAESPADMMQDTLIRSLQSGGAYRSVSGLRSNVRGDYIVRGHLYALDEVQGPALLARFSLQIELFDPKTNITIWSDSYAHDEPVTGKKVSDVVEALDRNVSAGLTQLTAHLAQYFADHPPERTSAQ
jgi:ABC-type uncharacterized transport system auxiliary subunit